MEEKKIRLINFLKEGGFSWEEKEIPYGLNLKLSSGVGINLYNGKKGFSWNVQGKRGQETENIKQEVSLLFSKVEISNNLNSFSNAYSKTWMGSDESGKGDVFGPLVFAGVALEPKEEIMLASSGIKDSKVISDDKILKLAGKIFSLGSNRIKILCLRPEKYNELYSNFTKNKKNLNHLMGWGHSTVIKELFEKNKNAKVAVVDQFGSETYVLNGLKDIKSKINIIHRTKAEENFAVAAASILARWKFIKWHQEMKENLGFELPKGAGVHCRSFMSKILQKEGKENFHKYVKMHFKPVIEFLG